MDIAISCQCGQTRGMAKNITPKTGNHLICMCHDCQAFAKHLGVDDQLVDEFGGTELFQVTPSQLSFSHGQDNLACLRLSPKGILRWYTKCCNTPIANTLASSRMPFAGLNIGVFAVKKDNPDFAKAFGPVIEKTFGRSARGGQPTGSSTTISKGLILHFMWFLLRAYALGKHKPSPFFDRKTGKPVVTPSILPKAAV